MAYVPVDVFVRDSSPASDPIENVVVRVFSENGSLVYGQSQTDAAGKASFLLPDGATYQLRFFKSQVSLPNPRYIEVLENETNTFDVVGSSLLPPAPTDIRLCAAYGNFRRPDGSPAVDVDIHFIAKFRPLLLDDAPVLTERLHTRTDRQGYMQINLIRLGEYDVTVEGFEDYQHTIYVPDAVNVRIGDLLFPVVSRITFAPAGPYVLAEGSEVTVTPAVIASDGRTLEGLALEDVHWSSSDLEVFTVTLAGGQLLLRAVGAGTATLLAARTNSTIVKYPDTPITGVPVSVVVS